MCGQVKCYSYSVGAYLRCPNQQSPRENFGKDDSKSQSLMLKLFGAPLSRVPTNNRHGWKIVSELNALAFRWNLT
jgi:hypothetical protein